MIVVTVVRATFVRMACFARILERSRKPGLRDIAQ
jgi:hypothetical protein